MILDIPEQTLTRIIRSLRYMAITEAAVSKAPKKIVAQNTDEWHDHLLIKKLIRDQHHTTGDRK